ncbi:N-acetylneuraminate 9-O-acetyltransferase-like [Macrobrachium rosenbergii]|uniref:N-acetylneuraminate 9-O-acetyltransferase-like n=1 Tax=Macrobrachium rosenbergii TaxID=79674 RepID=UPI0034D4D774
MHVDWSPNLYGWLKFTIIVLLVSAVGMITFLYDLRDLFTDHLTLIDITTSNTSNFPGLAHLKPYSQSCRCHSLFTIGACGMEEVASMRAKDARWVSATAELNRARFQQDILMMPQLQTISHYLPQLFKLNTTLAATINNSEATGNKHLSRAADSLPFVSCRVHMYTPSEIGKCTRKVLQDTGQPLRMAFVGDSRVRNTMEQIIRSTQQEIKYRLAGENNQQNMSVTFLNHKSKFNMPVIGDGIELRLHWSAYLELDRDPKKISQQGAKDLLEAWSNGTPGPDDGPIPDIAYITSGMWDSSMLPEDAAAESFIFTLEKMAPILKRLATRTLVLWHIHGPIKEWLATRDVPNGALDIMNRASWRWLADSNIWLWDSRTVLMLKQLSECRYLSQSTLKTQIPPEWGCFDFQHAGRDVEDAAANMLWNLVCNKVLQLPSEHCCS